MPRRPTTHAAARAKEREAEAHRRWFDTVALEVAKIVGLRPRMLGKCLGFSATQVDRQLLRLIDRGWVVAPHGDLARCEFVDPTAASAEAIAWTKRADARRPPPHAIGAMPVLRQLPTGQRRRQGE